MQTRVSALFLLLVTFEICTPGQSTAPPEQRSPQPLYQVTIVSRTTKAINYGYLSAATRIGFQGTPVAPSATGKGTIEPRRGATLLNLEFANLPRPQQFGAQYLTYVVWAISPDGRAQNVGELILDGSDKGKLRTSTPFQTFALIVTAEPYFSVSQPGGVVVLENVVTRDTIGNVQEVNATYELLPRQPYTYNAGTQAPTGQPVSSEQYESLAALYQALNAIQIAQSVDADRYAPEQLERARNLYNKARSFPVHLSKEIVSMAREATQIAEDSRAIAVKRAASEKTAVEETSTDRRESRPGASATEPVEDQTRQPKPQPQARVESGRGAHSQVVPASEFTTEPKAPVVVDHRQFMRDHPQARETRKRLLAALPRQFEALDSSRGVIVTIPGRAASSSAAQSFYSALAAAIKPLQGLHVKVEAHTDASGSVAQTEREATRVKQALVSAGISPEIIVPRGYGSTRPRSANANENRRIEIIMAGDAIGVMPVWDRSYTLRPSRAAR